MSHVVPGGEVAEQDRRGRRCTRSSGGNAALITSVGSGPGRWSCGRWT